MRHGFGARGALHAMGLALAVSLLGCDAFSPERPNLMVEPDVERPTPSVDLPPVPALELLDLPRQYEDGTWSVTGILLQREALRQTDLRLTGVIQEIYACELPTPEDAEGIEEAADSADAEPEALPTRDTVLPGCLRPHLFIADSMQSTRRLLVTGYLAAHWETQVSAGQRVTVVGRYAQEARGFISTEEGLLLAEAFEGEGIAPIPTEPDPDAAE